MVHASKTESRPLVFIYIRAIKFMHYNADTLKSSEMMPFRTIHQTTVIHFRRVNSTKLQIVHFRTVQVAHIFIHFRPFCYIGMKLKPKECHWLSVQNHTVYDLQHSTTNPVYSSLLGICRVISSCGYSALFYLYVAPCMFVNMSFLFQWYLLLLVH